jgi:hypothetical protein
MTDLIVALVLMLVTVAGAELVRLTCRRQMLSPVRTQPTAPAASRAAKLQLSR